MYRIRDSSMKNIGINGFGRIGRYLTRLSLERDDMNVVQVNDLTDIKTLAHLLKYDSVHRGLGYEFTIEGKTLVFENGKKITFTQHKEPSLIPWGDLEVEIVVESTGVFRTKRISIATFSWWSKESYNKCSRKKR